MAEIGFYHLLLTPLERALPRLLERASRERHRILVRAGSAERVAFLDALLWTYDEASFLPHGSERDGNAAAQPIWLTTKRENPNRASLLVLLDGVEANDLASFARCADLFDGKDEAAVAAARERWRRARDEGHAPLVYWRQTETGWQRQD
jgi:DNA polymerase-3 subunit chi